MRNIVTLSFFAVLALTGCEKEDIAKEVPDCIVKKIQPFTRHACDSGATVQEFIYQDKTVYVFSPGFCGPDLPSTVFDTNCNSLGSLWGITGNSKINGGDFAQATYIRTVWEN